MKSFTYGTLPEFNTFREAFVEQAGDTYDITVHEGSRDWAMLDNLDLFRSEQVSYTEADRRFKICFDVAQLYALLDSLAAIAEGHISHGEVRWSDEAMDWAGDFAASILATLGFEWV